MVAAVVDIAHGVPLARYTTFGVGGPAWGVADANGTGELAELVSLGAREQREILVVGGGSNLLVADAGFDGLVVRVRDRQLQIDDAGRVIAGAGVAWDDVVAASVERCFSGIECLSGIPGWAGAAPIQNIGAYGQEVAETLVAVTAFDRSTGRIDRIGKSACNFGYRISRFKRDWKERYVVLGVELQLERSPPKIRYGELSKHLDQLGSEPHSVEQVRSAVLAIRRSKSMVLDERDENRRSAGSFFMNPIVPSAVADEVERRAGQKPPRFPAGGVMGNALEKLSAAWLIERSGFSKGYGEGPAGLSTNHCLALINRGGATASDLLALATKIRAEVLARFGVRLMPEPVFVGFDPAITAAWTDSA